MRPLITGPKLATDEYIYSRGKASRDAAEERIESLICEGEISPAEKPRAARYTLADGVTARWAIVLTDTALSPYV
ncbi:hypothetical protein D2N39_11470 [Gemmobacter lutimaris]|uniref:Uncharacterized protein n=1 Tax=Gemmobacter lutimaris TaxID=2306023 RepID=A0A398BMB3_9RHOB|nr:hypothetical protein [Gemmobacter lutimaris]RID91849.1 hypothetical protein D2N39_11470 [Gemmobacter lutimaris]